MEDKVVDGPSGGVLSAEADALEEEEEEDEGDGYDAEFEALEAELAELARQEDAMREENAAILAAGSAARPLGVLLGGELAGTGVGSDVLAALRGDAGGAAGVDVGEGGYEPDFGGGGGDSGEELEVGVVGGFPSQQARAAALVAAQEAIAANRVLREALRRVASRAAGALEGAVAARTAIGASLARWRATAAGLRLGPRGETMRPPNPRRAGRLLEAQAVGVDGAAGVWERPVSHALELRVRTLRSALLRLTVVSQPPRWTPSEKAKLKTCITAQVRPAVTDAIYARMRAEGDCEGGEGGISAVQDALKLAEGSLEELTAEGAPHAAEAKAALAALDWERVAAAAPEMVKKWGLEGMRRQWEQSDLLAPRSSEWGEQDDKALTKAVEELGEYGKWAQIAARIAHGRTALQCLTRYRSKLKKGATITFKKGRWSAEEDEQLMAMAAYAARGDWTAVCTKVPTRSTSQCMHRWRQKHTYVNMTAPTGAGDTDAAVAAVAAPSVQLRKGRWTKEEDTALLKGVAACVAGGVNNLRGRKLYGVWTRVAAFVQGRSDAQCRERYNNVLDPAVNRGSWTQEESDRMLAIVRRLAEEAGQVQPLVDKDEASASGGSDGDGGVGGGKTAMETTVATDGGAAGSAAPTIARIGASPAVPTPTKPSKQTPGAPASASLAQMPRRGYKKENKITCFVHWQAVANELGTNRPDHLVQAHFRRMAPSQDPLLYNAWGEADSYRERNHHFVPVDPANPPPRQAPSGRKKRTKKAPGAGANAGKHCKGKDADEGEDYEDDAVMRCAPAYKATRRLRGSKRAAADQAQEVSCGVCGAAGDDARPLLRCGSCSAAFHADCLDPPLAAASKDGWRCARCEKRQAAIDARAARKKAKAEEIQRRLTPRARAMLAARAKRAAMAPNVVVHEVTATGKRKGKGKSGGRGGKGKAPAAPAAPSAAQTAAVVADAAAAQDAAAAATPAAIPRRPIPVSAGTTAVSAAAQAVVQATTAAVATAAARFAAQAAAKQPATPAAAVHPSGEGAIQLASLLAAAAHAPLPSQVSSRHVIEDAAVALEAAAITPPLSASGGVTNAAPRQWSRRRAATAASAAWAEVRPTKRPRSGGNY